MFIGDERLFSAIRMPGHVPRQSLSSKTGNSIGYAEVRTDAQAFGHMTTKIYRNHSQMFSHMVVRCAVFSVITMVSTIFCLNPLLLIREVHITPVKGNILI